MRLPAETVNRWKAKQKKFPNGTETPSTMAAAVVVVVVDVSAPYLFPVGFILIDFSSFVSIPKQIKIDTLIKNATEEIVLGDVIAIHLEVVGNLLLRLHHSRGRAKDFRMYPQDLAPNEEKDHPMSQCPQAPCFHLPHLPLMPKAQSPMSLQ